MEKAYYTRSGVEAVLNRLPEWMERIAEQVSAIELPSVDRIYLSGTGAGYASAFALRNAFAAIPGFTGEQVHVVTPSHLRLSVPESQRMNALAILFGDAAAGGASSCKASVGIARDGDLRLEGDGILETYLQMSAAGLLLAAKLRQQAGMAEKLLDAVRIAKEHLALWDAGADKAIDGIQGLADGYETVGTGGDYAAAWLVRMLIYARGLDGVTTVEESEDWLHVNFLQLTPERFATFVFLSSENEAVDRTLRTIQYIEGVGRRTVIFTDLRKEELEAASPVITLPHMEKELLPIFMPLPAALLVGRLR